MDMKPQEQESRLTVTRLPGRSTLIIRQHGSPNFFISSYNVITIDIPTLAFLIKFLVQNNFVSRKVLEGILSEISE